MKIDGTVHCMFEQSGTFKNQFKRLGINAVDYDIQNNFGQTDFTIDLFAEIEKCYSGGGGSIFDSIQKEDLIMAFFPCIYFCNLSQLAFTYDCTNYRAMNIKQMTNAILERDKNRSYFYGILLKLFSIIKEKGLRMILENPATSPHYLLFPQNFVQKPTMIDYNRNARGDIYKKMTAYWFVNCLPTHRHSFEKGKELKRIQDMASGLRAGICSEERSMMTESYARNFICDNIIGCDNVVLQQPDLFE